MVRKVPSPRSLLRGTRFGSGSGPPRKEFFPSLPLGEYLLGLFYVFIFIICLEVIAVISVSLKSKSPKFGAYVGRPSPLGNPYVIGKHGSREEVIAKYRIWLWSKIKSNDPVVCAELHRLVKLYKSNGENLVLTCWCSPLPCHADVIKAAIEWHLSKVK